MDDQALVLLLDVRAITKNAKTGGTYTSQPVGWSFLTILNAGGCVAAGSYQLPLFVGDVRAVSDLVYWSTDA